MSIESKSISTTLKQAYLDLELMSGTLSMSTLIESALFQ